MANRDFASLLQAAAQAEGWGLDVRNESTPTNAELKALVEEGNRAYHEFQENVEKRLKEIEARGTPTAETEEKLQNINSRMDEIMDKVSEAQRQQERIDELEASFNNAQFGGSGSGPAGFSPQDVALFNSLVGHRGAQVDAKQLDTYKNALMQYARMGNAVGEQVRNELTVGNDPEGGYWVTPDMDGRIIQFLRETSNVRQEAAQQTIGTESLEGDYDLGQADFGWVGEKDSRTETNTPDVGEWEIFAHELYAMPQATQKVLDDANIDVEQWLVGKIQDRFRRAEERAFVNGNGVKKPRGFLTYPVSDNEPDPETTFERIQRVKTGTSGGFGSSNPADVFIDIQHNLKPDYRENGVFAMNRATIAETRKLKDGDGNYLLVPNFSQPGQMQILGDPVRVWDDMPDIGSGSLSIAYGNFGQAYQIVDRRGMRLLRDPYTTKGRVKIYATRRVGGGVVNFDALKLIEFSS